MGYSKKWNKPANGDGRTRIKAAPKARVRSLAALAAVAAIVVAAAMFIASWHFSGRGGARPSDEAGPAEERPTRDSQTSPRKSPDPLPRQAEDKKPVPYWELDESHTNGFSEAQLRKWRNVRRPRMKPFTRERPKARYEIFDHRSENMIACLLAAKPGTGFIGTPNYRGIDEDFLKSCERPIIVTKDDDEYSASLKRQMIEVKIDIKQRMDAGESLADILQSSREEMKKLASYRQFLAEEIRKVEISGASVETVKDFVDAANRMLAERGIAPISPGPITMNRLKHLNKEGANE